MTRLTATAIVAVVLLRLLTGWHFFNEGVKKFDPGFSSAGFLRTAKGPFAPMFKSMVTGPHGAYAELSRPVEFESPGPEALAELAAWRSDYGKLSAAAAKSGDPLPADMPAVAPGYAWFQQIESDWNSGLKRLGRLGLDDETATRLEQLRDQRLSEVVHYLYTQSIAIEDLQHEAWRLEQMKSGNLKRAPAPFQADRIAEKDAEIWGTMQPWVRSVNDIEQAFAADAAAASGIGAERVRGAVAGPSTLGWVDSAVKVVVLACGVCVFLGLATRLAAVVAAGFLLSLILTQPPWAAGADLTAFFNWSIELAAFLVLAAVGAGRWAGVDGLLHAARVRFGDLSPRYQAGIDRPASAATA